MLLYCLTYPKWRSWEFQKSQFLLIGLHAQFLHHICSQILALAIKITCVYKQDLPQLHRRLCMKQASCYLYWRILPRTTLGFHRNSIPGNRHWSHAERQQYSKVEHTSLLQDRGEVSRDEVSCSGEIYRSCGDVHRDGVSCDDTFCGEVSCDDISCGEVSCDEVLWWCFLWCLLWWSLVMNRSLL